MPNIVYGDITKGNFQAILSSSDHYDYDYPEGLNLDPKSELHRKVVTEVIRRAQVSNRVMSNRFGSWNEIDRILTTYIEPDSSLNLREGEEKDIKKDKSKKPVSIIFPYSYAILETILTYLVMAFLEDPIFAQSTLIYGYLILMFLVIRCRKVSSAAGLTEQVL